jgi:hypothetical protein
MKIRYKTKREGRKLLMECKRGCGTYTTVSEAAQAVVCSNCHTKELYDPNTYIVEENDIECQ